LAKRYEQIKALIDSAKPSAIVEVGVHRAMRAMLMSEWALGHRKDVSYLGFDVFETMDKSFHEAALNGKGIPSKAMAEARMVSVAERFHGFQWKFIEGDTRITLHGSHVKCDFAFIDGDHRVDVIRGDAGALDCPLIVFDDYYLAGDSLPDLDKFGANRVVEELKDDGWSIDILPAGDRCDHGGIAHLAVARR
jgi:hypothetical protein